MTSTVKDYQAQIAQFGKARKHLLQLASNIPHARYIPSNAERIAEGSLESMPMFSNDIAAWLAQEELAAIEQHLRIAACRQNGAT